ncbi:DNA polymerase processivity factor [Arthrobacter phage Beans]|uniref:DNA polymerase III sliding clamp beta subunit n=1 Tax=Arthrobacter phage Beans TaxID=2015815 RepID=A0A222ZL39_9CAUD|nr:DNA polymerase processivity factor [Arthrobacter phage Beans]ASR84750.1 DNA polymerase III sliding clamp beta subunit [Arthrobacter phage Beans]
MTTATLTEKQVESVTKTKATMKVADVLRTLGIVRQTDTRNPIIPILGCVLLTGKHGELSLTTNNYEASIAAVVPGSRSDDFEMLLPLRYMLDLIKVIATDKSEEMTIEVLDFLDKRIAVFAAGGFRMPIAEQFTLDQFPSFSGASGPAAFSIQPDALKTAIKRAAVSASKDQTLPILTAIQFNAQKSDSTLQLRTTDRYRLSFVSEQANVMQDAQFLINCDLLMRLAPKIKQKAPVSVVVESAERKERDKPHMPGQKQVYFNGETVVKFIFEDFVLHTKGVDGDYPKIEQLIQPSYANTFRVNRKQLVHNATVAARLSARNLPCHFELLGDKMLLKPSRDGLDVLSAGLVEVPATHMTPNAQHPLSFAVNPHYLLPALKSFESDIITFSLPENLAKPLLISGDDEHAADSAFRYLMMPVRMPD